MGVNKYTEDWTDDGNLLSEKSLRTEQAAGEEIGWQLTFFRFSHHFSHRDSLGGVFMGHLWSIRRVFMGYTYVSGMCRVCIGYVSGMRRDIIGAKRVLIQISCRKSANEGE